MRLSLRYRMFAVPLLLLLGTAAATAYAAVHAAHTADERIAERVQAVARTLQGPPTFPLTLPVLEQIKQLSGAELSVNTTETFPGLLTAEPRKGPISVNGQQFLKERLELPDHHPNAGAYVFIYFPEAIREREIAVAVRPVLILGLGGGCIAAALSWLVGRRLVRRIRELEAGTRAVAAGQFSPLPLPAADDELRDLVVRVNEMAARLAANAESLKQAERLRVLGQVSGGLAHQLRNAATGAKLAVELAANDPDDREPLTVAMKQLQRMDSILRQFLELGRPDEQPRKACDLGPVLERSVVLIAPQASHRGVSLNCILPATPVTQTIDAEQFGHLLENLLTNAIEAAGPGGKVNVILTDTRIEVIDSGPGPSSQVAEKLFEPFATDKPGGIGLGLMVAKQVTDAHGMSLTWCRREGRTVFALEFVAAAPQR